MSEHRYILEKYGGRSTRHHCPDCKQSQAFARYVDTETGQYVADDVGRCNRSDRCGYHRTPRQYFEDHPEYGREREYRPARKEPATRAVPPQRQPDYIPKEYLIRSIGFNSNFVLFLCSLFDRYTLESPTIERLMRDYCIGCTKSGAVIYWQLDQRNRIRTGKIMQYNPETGNRIKRGIGAFDWVHAKLKRDKVLPDDFNHVQCLFGTHLLRKYPDKPVCIVESEKSALIGAGAMPEYLWLATGGKQALNAEKCQVLKNRSVMLFPDLGAFDDWSEKAAQIEKAVNCKILVVDLLEKIATDEDRDEGLDIADYLIRELRGSSLETGIPGSVEVENPTSALIQEVKGENPAAGIPIPAPDEITASPPDVEADTLRRFGDRNPNIYPLIDTLGLVSTATGRDLRIMN